MRQKGLWRSPRSWLLKPRQRKRSHPCFGLCALLLDHTFSCPASTRSSMTSSCLWALRYFGEEHFYYYIISSLRRGRLFWAVNLSIILLTIFILYLSDKACLFYFLLKWRRKLQCEHERNQKQLPFLLINFIQYFSNLGSLEGASFSDYISETRASWSQGAVIAPIVYLPPLGCIQADLGYPRLYVIHSFFRFSLRYSLRLWVQIWGRPGVRTSYFKQLAGFELKLIPELLS